VHDVPGSAAALDLLSSKQLRYHSITLAKPKLLDRIILESLTSEIAPVFAGITLEGRRPAGRQTVR
jgi:hypothetical protein